MDRFMEIVGDRLGDVYSERGLGGLYGMGMDSAVGRRFAGFRKDYSVFFELPWYGDLMVGCNPFWAVAAWVFVLGTKVLVALPFFEQSFGRVEVCTFGGLFCSVRESFWFYDFLKSFSTDRWLLTLSFLSVGCFFGNVRLPDGRKRSAFVSMVMVGIASWYFSSISLLGQFCYVGEIYSAVLAVLIAKDMSAGFSLFYFWFVMKLVIGFPLPGFLVVWFFSQVSVQEQVEVAVKDVMSQEVVACEDVEMDVMFRKVLGVERPAFVDVRSVWKVDPQDPAKFSKVEKLALKGDRVLKVMLADFALARGATTEQCSLLEQMLQSDKALTNHLLITDKSWCELPQRFRGKCAATTLEAVFGVWFEHLGMNDYRSKEIFQKFSDGVAISNGYKLSGVELEKGG